MCWPVKDRIAVSVAQAQPTFSLSGPSSLDSFWVVSVNSCGHDGELLPAWGVWSTNRDEVCFACDEERRNGAAQRWMLDTRRGIRTHDSVRNWRFQFFFLAVRVRSSSSSSSDMSGYILVCSRHLRVCLRAGNRYSASELAHAPHPHMLHSRHACHTAIKCLHTDVRMMGLGGADSWNPRVDEKYLVPSGVPYNCCFRVMPRMKPEV